MDETSRATTKQHPRPPADREDSRAPVRPSGERARHPLCLDETYGIRFGSLKSRQSVTDRARTGLENAGKRRDAAVTDAEMTYISPTLYRNRDSRIPLILQTSRENIGGKKNYKRTAKAPESYVR